MFQPNQEVRTKIVLKIFCQNYRGLKMFKMVYLTISLLIWNFPKTTSIPINTLVMGF